MGQGENVSEKKKKRPPKTLWTTILWILCICQATLLDGCPQFFKKFHVTLQENSRDRERRGSFIPPEFHCMYHKHSSCHSTNRDATFPYYQVHSKSVVEQVTSEETSGEITPLVPSLPWPDGLIQRGREGERETLVCCCWITKWKQQNDETFAPRMIHVYCSNNARGCDTCSEIFFFQNCFLWKFDPSHVFLAMSKSVNITYLISEQELLW